MTILKVVEKKQKNKTKSEISGLSPNYFQGRVWPDLWSGMASLCGLFLCVIDGNFITYLMCCKYVDVLVLYILT